MYLADNYYDRTHAKLAAEYGLPKVVQVLIQKKRADKLGYHDIVNNLNAESFIEAKCVVDWAIQHAAQFDNLQMIILLHRHGQDIDEALEGAVIRDNILLIKILAAMGAKKFKKTMPRTSNAATLRLLRQLDT